MDRTETLAVDDPGAGERPATPGVVITFSMARIPGDGVYAARDELPLGRSPDCHIFLEDPSLSRVHAVFCFGPGGATVEDRGSHNGTFVNGSRATGSQAVEPGDVIRCGRTLLTISPDTAGFAGWRRWGSAGPVIGGPAMRRMVQELAAFAASELEVLLLGESGTGKDLAARQVHAHSDRAGELVAVNCAELAESLFEAELFGARKGAYTGATADRAGLFVAANGGTLFLDEVGELPLNLQAKLLRALEQREIRPVGGNRTVKVDVRLVSDTNRDLARQVEQGAFREDLFHRLRGAEVYLPALREHTEDIPLLLEHIAGDAPPPTVDFVEKLMLHRWPGNVRELDRVLREAVARARAAGSDALKPSHLREELRRPPPPSEDDTFQPVKEALTRNKGNVSAVAAELGMHRAQIYSMLRDRGVSASDFR